MKSRTVSRTKREIIEAVITTLDDNGKVKANKFYVGQLVRCKDCDNRGSSDCPIEKLCPGWLPNDEWFCADGEPKEGEQK